MIGSIHLSDELDVLIADRQMLSMGHFWMRDNNVTALWWPMEDQVVLRRDGDGDGVGYIINRFGFRTPNILETLTKYLGYCQDTVFDVSDLHVYTVTYPDNDAEHVEETTAPTNFHQLTWSDFVYANQRFSCDVRVVTNEEAEAVRAAADAASRAVWGGGGGASSSGGGGAQAELSMPTRVLTPSCAHGSCRHCLLPSDDDFKIHTRDDE